MSGNDSVEYSFDYDGENFTMKLREHVLVGCQWIPNNIPVRFVLIFFHGLGAFVAINRPYFPYLIQHGGAILGTDHLGHGRSPGDRGYNSSELLIEEITLLIKRATMLFPDTPLFLYGHSMGGLASIAYSVSQKKFAKQLDGVIIEAPWLNDTEEVIKSVPHTIIGKFGRYLFPSLIIDTGDGIGKTSYPQQFIDSYSKSNLPHDFITPKLYASTYELREIIQDNFKNWPFDLPLLFMQGALDQSVGVERNLKFAETLRDMRPKMVKLVYHIDAEHAMLRNACGNIILKEVVDFIEESLSKCCRTHF